MNLTGMLGNRAERKALKYLNQKGMRPIESNYHCRFGEIDLIMRDQEYLVFVEVRFRKSDLFGGALASVDRRKQAKLRRSAAHYLIRHKLNDRACRFDILCLEGELRRPTIEWVKNAF